VVPGRRVHCLAPARADIVTAMTDGTFFTVQTSSVPGGALVPNGATLAYALLCVVAGTG
jgi:hypothetical protein